MKRFITTMLTITLAYTGFAQVDSTKTITPSQDTIHIGNMIIIRKKGAGNNDNDVTIRRREYTRSANVSTNWWIFDLGFANWDDKTNYADAALQNVVVNKSNGQPLATNDFKLKQGKSSNVNIWVFMQKLNLVKHYVNFKYGFGVELNNYRFKSPISFKEAGPNPYSPAQFINHPFVFRDSIGFSKDKLSADYVTVPFMLNINTNPRSKSSFNFSAGASIGYLYSTRNKQKSDERGKHKNRGDYDLEKWKVSYVAELGMGPIRLYGSYTPNSIFSNSLNLKSYNVGLRLSNW